MQVLHLTIFVYLYKLTVQNIVFTAQGNIRGIVKDGYISYVGIPYASIDNNAGRFKQAGLAPVWSGVRESRDPLCTASSEGENCLQLDVNTPTAGTSLPVLAWIKGSSGNYNSGRLVKSGIIVVIVRHRLGPLGFLCSKEHKIPGNTALKDALLALRWIRDNIIAFNGNPNKVVVGGQGFGAAMVEALMLSPKTRGLFHGVILQSGTVLAPWAFNFDAENRAKFLNMNLNDARNLSSLSKIATADLVNMAEEVEMPYLPFGMCIEQTQRNEEKLISKSPIVSLSNGDINMVPMIIGYNSNEAYVFSTIIKAAKVFKRITNDVTFLLPIELQGDRREIPKLMKQIKDMYFIENVTIKSLLNYHRDAYFLGHIHKTIHFHAVRNPVYYYQFSHFGNVGVGQEPGIAKWGAAHSDELAYLFAENGRRLEGDDGAIQDRLIQLWTNFVKRLTPTYTTDAIQWEPVNPENPRLLNIEMDTVMMDFPYEKETRMWEDIYAKHYFKM